MTIAAGIVKEIQKAFENAMEIIGRIRKIGYRLLKDAGYIDSDEEEPVMYECLCCISARFLPYMYMYAYM